MVSFTMTPERYLCEYLVVYYNKASNKRPEQTSKCYLPDLRQFASLSGLCFLVGHPHDLSEHSAFASSFQMQSVHRNLVSLAFSMQHELDIFENLPMDAGLDEPRQATRQQDYFHGRPVPDLCDGKRLAFRHDLPGGKVHAQDDCSRHTRQ